MARSIDPLKELQVFVAGFSTKTAAAAALEISAAYLHDMLTEQRNISEPMLAKLGLERIETVVKK